MGGAQYEKGPVVSPLFEARPEGVERLPWTVRGLQGFVVPEDARDGDTVAGLDHHHVSGSLADAYVEWLQQSFFLLDSVVMSDVHLSYLSNSLDGSWRRLMGMAHRRHDISDRVWLLLEPHLPGRAGSWGGVAQDNRRFINAIFWILRTGAPWRDVPPDYGDWKNTHRRFCRWRDKGLWGGGQDL